MTFTSLGACALHLSRGAQDSFQPTLRSLVAVSSLLNHSLKAVLFGVGVDLQDYIALVSNKLSNANV